MSKQEIYPFADTDVATSTYQSSQTKPREKMIYYFIVGEQAVWEYPDAQKVADAINNYDGDLICFDTDTMTPPQLLEMFNGWRDHIDIGECLYDEINNLLKQPR